MFAHRFPHTSWRSLHLAILTAAAYYLLAGLFRWFGWPLPERHDEALYPGILIPGWVAFATTVLSAGVVVWIFTRLLALTVSGSRPYERLWYAGLFLSLAPIFIKNALRAGPESLALALVLAVWWLGFRMLEQVGGHFALFAVLLSGLSWWLWPALAWLLFPLLFAITVRLYERRRWGWLVLYAAGLAAALFFWWRLWPENWSYWSLVQLFGAPAGAGEWAPNALWLLYTLVHPGFCLLLPLLFLLVKRTELHHLERQLLLAGLAVYLAFTGGLPRSDVGVLLPAYLLVLLLLFPAWDRLLSWGFYVLKKKYMYGILSLILLVQLISGVWVLFLNN